MNILSAGLSQADVRADRASAWGAVWLDNGIGCWVTATGRGAGEEFAARLAAGHFLTAFRRATTLSRETMAYCLEAAHTAVFLKRKTNTDWGNMRATLSALAVDRQMALWAQAGPARLYHFRTGLIEFCSQKRSPRLPGAKNKPGYRQPSALGADARHWRPVIATTPLPLMAGDAFLLCADDFWENVWETEMELDLAKSLAPETWLELMAERCAQRSPKIGDDHAVTAVWIEE